MHTSLEVSYRRRRVMIDAGQDWLGELGTVRPHAIVVTHAHPDHAWGLADGAPCPVYATDTTWEAMHDYAIPAHRRRRVAVGAVFEVEGISFEAFGVAHSIRAPAVGYRVRAGRAKIFYVPDVVYIEERDRALAGVDLYIGDGATMAQSFVRRRGDTLIGHTPVRTQLTWCQKAGVPRAIISHCGAEIVDGDPAALQRQLDEWASARGVTAEFACDGMERILR